MTGLVTLAFFAGAVVGWLTAVALSEPPTKPPKPTEPTGGYFLGPEPTSRP